MIAIIFSLFQFIPPVQAHTLDTAFFDFEQTASGTVLTVAMQPPQAFEVIHKPEDKEWNLERFRERGEMLATFVASRMALSRGGRVCDWSPAMGVVASSTLDILADGITVAGPIVCPDETGAITLETDLFTDRFPGQENIVRYAVVSEGRFDELAILSSSSRRATVDVASLARSKTSRQTGRDPLRPVALILALFGLATLLAPHFMWRRIK